MNGISAKYFSTQFITENKLKLSDINILEYIYSWVLSDNPPEFKEQDGRKAFYLSQSHIAKDFEGLITQPAVSQKIKRLEKCGIIKTTLIDSFKGKFYVCFNWDKVISSLACRELLQQQKYRFCSNWFEKIFAYIDEEKKIEQEWKDEWNKKSFYERIKCIQDNEQNNSYNKNEEENMLLDESDMNAGKKRGYSKQADSIAKRILKKYAQCFTTKYPAEGQEPTKTYVRLCRKIDDIYNGRFTLSRFYQFDNCVFENKQFETANWRETINEVKNDWNKVKQLIFNAVDNFVLMYEPDRMPMNKDYLTTNLSDWFYSDNPNCKGQSQFIQSLNEPMFTKQKLGLNKAKAVVEELKKKSSVSYHAGHELNELLPVNANEATAWNYIQEIIKWGKLLWQFDKNSHYFMQCRINNVNESGPKVLPALFARYLKDKGINVSLNTLNIEQAVDNNGPWCWFIKDACKKHDINEDYLQCLEADDFYDASEGNKKIGFYDMEEIPVF